MEAETHVPLVTTDGVHFTFSVYSAEKARSLVRSTTLKKWGTLEGVQRYADTVWNLQQEVNDKYKAGRQQEIERCRTEAAPKTRQYKRMGTAPTVTDDPAVIDAVVQDTRARYIENPSAGPPLDAASLALGRIQFRTSPQLHLDPRTGNTGALIGSSKSGKSTTMMMLYRRYFREVSGEPNPYICTLFAQNSHIPLYADSKLIITDDLTLMDPYLRDERRINQRTGNHYKFVTFIDDFINVRYVASINESIMSYRNSNISTFVCVHSAKTLSKTARSSVNNVMLFNCNMQEQVEELLALYLRGYFREMGVCNHEDQIRLFRMITRDHGYIHIVPATGEIAFYRLELGL